MFVKFVSSANSFFVSSSFVSLSLICAKYFALSSASKCGGMFSVSVFPSFLIFSSSVL